MSYRFNQVTLAGRITKDPDIRYTQGGGEGQMCIAHYTLAIDRRRREGADFIPCVSFGRAAEFVERNFKKGLPVAVTGRIQTGSYTNKDGKKVYTTDIITNDVMMEPNGTASMNHVVLSGRLTRDPEYREAGETHFARLSVAVPRNNGKDEADFISCVSFAKGAEFCRDYLKKGTAVTITGRIQTGSYTNREGQKVFTEDVLCEDIQFSLKKAVAADKASDEGGTVTNSETAAAAPGINIPVNEEEADQFLEGIGIDGFVNVSGDEEELPFV